MSGSWPATRQWLEENGFTFEARKRCNGKTCGMTIEWYRTPAGRMLPLNIVAPNNAKELRPHWECCPDAQEFRSKPAPERPAKEVKPAKQKPQPAKTGMLF